MEMKIDGQRVKQLREQRGWSQEHLASLTGLSARTIQRIETGGTASPESRMALAAALEIDSAQLSAAPAPIPPAPTPTPLAAEEPTRQRSVLRRLTVYILVCGTLVLGDIQRHGGITWSKWPLLGWGLALAIHFFKRYRRLHAHTHA